MRKFIKNAALNWASVTAGCALYAISFTMFFQSNNIAIGGFTGLSQVINRLFPVIPIGLCVVSLNVPLMIIGLKTEGPKLLFSSVYAISLSSFLIDWFGAVLPSYPATDKFPGCIFGSVLLGTSLGFLLRCGATTGGTELLARLVRRKNRALSIGKICLITDLSVICLYSLTFKSIDTLSYGVIAMYISSVSLDYVVYGSPVEKIAFVISEKTAQISNDLLDNGFGFTVIGAFGGKTGKSKPVLLCAVKNHRINLFKKIVSGTDPSGSFVVVCDAKEIFGNGFDRYDDNRL